MFLSKKRNNDEKMNDDVKKDNNTSSKTEKHIEKRENFNVIPHDGYP